MRRATLVVGVLLCISVIYFSREVSRISPKVTIPDSPPILKVKSGADNHHSSFAIEPHIEPVADGFALEGVKEDARTGPGWRNPAKPVLPHFPKSFDGAVRVKSGVADLSATPLGAKPSSGKIAADGSLVYENAFEGCDVKYRCSALKTEEFLIVHDKRAQSEWSWNLDLGTGESELKPRLTPMHTIELCDKKGVPRLRINAPEGKDAAGKRMAAGEHLKFRIDGSRVTLSLDAKGLKYPLTIDPSWSSTGSMAIARVQHSAVLLNNGTVLVAGGGGNFIECEVFDPNTEVWSATGSMAQARKQDPAIILTNGKVLAIGSSFNSPTSCEVYDPATGVWNPTGSLITGREEYHSAVLLQNGHVLVTGGFFNNNDLTASEIYDPQSGQWTATGSLNNARSAHTATVLTDGSVLICGGEATSTALAVAELYDPATGVFTLIAPTPTVHSYHVATLLTDGTVLVAGGQNNGPSPAISAASEIFNPATQSWSTTGSLITRRAGFAGLTINNGMTLATGGGDPETIGLCELFDPSTAVWNATAPLANPRANHTATKLSDGRVLVTGGFNPSPTSTASCEIFDINGHQSPIVNPSVSPPVAAEGQNVLFSANGADPDGNPLTYTWDFGDGSALSGADVSHSYLAAGTYTATVAANDGFVTSNGNVTITIFHDSDRPTARFVASDLTGYVGQPVGFDATFSSDPQNNIVSYQWDFGDGSPFGSGQLISRVYTTEGTYLVTLSIADGRGLTDSTSMTMVILPASDSGLFTSTVKYTASWDRKSANKDALNLVAQLNSGATSISAGTPLSLDIVGQTFAGSTVAARGAGKVTASATNPNTKFSLKPGKKGSPKGTVELKVSIRHANLGAGFAQAGATGSKSASLKIPIRLGIGSSSFSAGVNSQFRFGSNGTRGSGSGVGH